MRRNSITSPSHREIFSQSYQINPKSDCIHPFPIDLEQQMDDRLVPYQSVHGKYNLTPV